MDPRLTHWLVIGKNCWGRGTTKREAARICREANGGPVGTAFVFRVPELTHVDGLGRIVYSPGDAHPVQVGELGRKA